MGIVGAILVARWSIGLLGDTSAVLLDRQVSPELEANVRDAIEQDGDSRVTDLHIWSIGPGIYAAQIALVAHQLISPDEYKYRLPDTIKLVHVSIEIHLCDTHKKVA